MTKRVPFECQYLSNYIKNTYDTTLKANCTFKLKIFISKGCVLKAKICKVSKYPLKLGFRLKKVIVSQSNVNHISYISILQFGENYGLGHKGEMGFSLNRSLNTHVIKILRLFNLWELAFWHHLTQKDHNFLLYLLKYLWGYFYYHFAQLALEIERKTDF